MRDGDLMDVKREMGDVDDGDEDRFVQSPAHRGTFLFVTVSHLPQ